MASKGRPKKSLYDKYVTAFNRAKKTLKGSMYDDQLLSKSEFNYMAPPHVQCYYGPGPPGQKDLGKSPRARPYVDAQPPGDAEAEGGEGFQCGLQFKGPAGNEHL